MELYLALSYARPRRPTYRFIHRPVQSSTQRRDLFNRIAPVYDYLNDLLSLGQHRYGKEWQCHGVDIAKMEDSVLDLCCGSGDLAFLLSEKVGSQGKVIGLDFSKELLSVASSRQKLLSKPCYENIDLLFHLEWTIDNVVVPVATNYGLADEYRYLKSSINEFLTGKELERLTLEVGFSKARHYEISGGFMGNLVATR
nr:2-phytyl-1,4-beta-naphthoquinone methyltransferase, chloroplastic-like isoform X3 [Ziziphus jujuba var. spinosa]